MKTLEEMIAWLDSPEGKASVENYANKYLIKEEEIKSYFETDDFEILFIKVAIRVDTVGPACDEHYDGMAFNDVTDAQLYKLVHSIFLNKGYENKFTDFGFPCDECVYRGLRFQMIHGQGSWTVVTKVEG